MSIFLKPGQMKVKDENGDYTGINVLAEESAAEYMEAMETKAAELEDAIETKGEETIESIPSDYTELTNEVNEVKGINETIYTFDPVRTPSTTADGWRLNPETGLCYSASGYTLFKYGVTPGKKIKVVTDGCFQFQDSSSVPASGTSKRIGITYDDSGFIFTVPSGATYLIVSTTTSGTSNVYDVGGDISDLRDLFNRSESDFGRLKNATVIEKLGSDLEYTANEEGGSWRYINGAWTKTKTSALAYFHMVTYEVTAGHRYRVKGRHNSYTPLATFWTDDSTEPIGCTEDGYGADQTSAEITLDITIPKNITSIVVSAFGLSTFPSVKEITYENVSSQALTNLRESALTIELDTTFVKFETTATGLDITLPYRCYVIGDKSGVVYEKKLNNLTTGTFTISWNLTGFVILDLTTGVVTAGVGWSDMFTQANPFVVLASRGKRVRIGRVYRSMIGDGALLPYFNQYMIAQLNADRDKYLPPYYYFENDYIQNKIVDIREAAKESDVSFGFITDVHLGVNDRKSLMLMKYIGDNTNSIPFVLFGGDVPMATGESGEDALSAGDQWLELISVYGKEKVFQCKGNHDYMINITGEPTYHADEKADYYYIRKANENLVEGEAGNLYYYFDDDVNKVRYIVLDNYDYGYSSEIYNTTGMSQDQYDWLIDALGADGYDILVLSHQTSDATLSNYESVLEPLQRILKAFVAKTTLSYTGNNVSLTADFTGSTSRLICHLSGHSHVDESHTDDDVLSIATVCDAYYSAPSGYTRTVSTITEQAFDVFCINKTSRSINIIRIGAGQDREFTY